MDRFSPYSFDISYYYNRKYEASDNETQSIPVKQNKIKSLQPSSKSFRISEYVQILQSVFAKLKVVYRISDHHPQALVLSKIIESSSCKTKEDKIDFVDNVEPNIKLLFKQVDPEKYEELNQEQHDGAIIQNEEFESSIMISQLFSYLQSLNAKDLNNCNSNSHLDLKKFVKSNDQSENKDINLLVQTTKAYLYW